MLGESFNFMSFLFEDDCIPYFAIFSYSLKSLLYIGLTSEK